MPQALPYILFLVCFAAIASGEEHGNGHSGHDSGRPHWEWDQDALESSPSRLSGDVKPLDPEEVPDRPRPLIEAGEPFLGTGEVSAGITLPGGAVWRPSLLVYGTARTAVQSFDNGVETFSEVAARLDLFANVQLSGTERIHVGVRPVDNDGRFLSYLWEPAPGADGDGGWRRPWNANLHTYFFEGDLGEMFPVLDQADKLALDYGFSVGRQPLLFQDGLFLNDVVDSVGVTRNTLRPDGTSNLRITGLFGWDEINRGDNALDGGGSLVGLFTEIDLPTWTVNFDSAWAEGDPDAGDALFFALSGVRRLGHLGLTLRGLTSIPLEGETSASGRGTLLFGEASYTLPESESFLYGTAWWAIDRFSSVARDPNTGGPLGRAGILFDAVGLGTYGSPLSNQTDSAFGGTLGAQLFFDETRRQLILEAGGRLDTNEVDQGALALGARLQQAVGQRLILEAGGFTAFQEHRDQGWGGRFEMLFKF